MTIKHYACQNCGHPFEASPPDDIYCIASRKECLVFGSGLMKCLIIQKYECGNCDESTTLHWHRKSAHTSKEIKKARELMKNLVSPLDIDENKE